MSEARDWLPVDAARRPDVRSPVEDAVAAWSRHWLAVEALSITRWSTSTAERRGDADGGGWRLHRGAVAISCSRRSAARVAGMALDAIVEDERGAEPDRRVVQRFTAELLGDLAQRIEQVLGVDAGPRAAPRLVDDPFDNRGGVVLTIGSGASDLFSLAIALRDFLPFCRQFLPPAPARRARPLARLGDALGARRVTLEATLGAARLTLPELRNLAPGDILTLDRRVAEPAQLGLRGGEGLVSGALTSAEGRLALVLAPKSS